MFRLRIALVSGIAGLGLLASPSIAGDLSGMFSLTKGKANIGPKSAKYDFNDINFLGRLVLKDSYFLSSNTQI